jgi:hypothetical protein
MTWQKSYWRFIHYFSIHNQYLLLCQFGDFIGHDVFIVPAYQQNLIDWSIDLHNKLNTQNNKYDKWNLTDFNIAQKSTCDLCENAQVFFNFPWGFIHEIAKSTNTNTLNFLQDFNTFYPCTKCRGTFFTDTPFENESIFDWTIRNHQRIDSTFFINSSIIPSTSAVALAIKP